MSDTDSQRTPTSELVRLPSMSSGTLVLFDVESDTLDHALATVNDTIAGHYEATEAFKNEARHLLRQAGDLGPHVLDHTVAIFHFTTRAPGPVAQVLVRLANPLDLPDAQGNLAHFLWVLISPYETHPHVSAVAEFAQLMGEAAFRQTVLAAQTPEQLNDAYNLALYQDVRQTVDNLPSELRPTGRLFGGVRQDIQRRLPHYLSDIVDGLNSRSIATIIFLFFACLAPEVAFGGVLSALTGGELGVAEVLFAAAICGALYTLLSGQPLTIVGSTGPIVVYIGILARVCANYELPFVPTMSIIGYWTALFLFVLAAIDGCSLVRYFTRFTDDIFAALISLIFISQSVKSLAQYYFDGAEHAVALLSVVLAAGTYIMAANLSRFRKSPYLRRNAREFLADFGPTIAIVSMTLVGYAHMLYGVTPAGILVPDSFSTSSGRPWMVDVLSLPSSVILTAALPALLLTSLIFLSHNITVRLINAPEHQLKKGTAYHLDLAALSLCIFVCSLFGLPWVKACTVRSLNHVRSLAKVSFCRKGAERIESITETRVTGFAIALAFGVVLCFLPVLRNIPMPVLYGLFLYMGVQSLTGNQFFERIKLWLTDPDRYSPTHYLRAVPQRTRRRFTAIQLLCLAVLWAVKVSEFGILFPLFIVMLLFVRIALSRYFKPEHLALLDAEEEPRENDGYLAR